MFDKYTKDRFSCGYSINAATLCWVWNGSKDKDGYGQFQIGSKNFRPHRISYQIHKGKIPKGLCVLHKCDNPPCVNPEHLFLGTRADNVIDCIQKGRKPVGFKHYNSKLDENDILILIDLLKRGYSYCYIAKKINMTDSNVGKIARGEIRPDLVDIMSESVKKPIELIDEPEKSLYWMRSNKGWKQIKRTIWQQKFIDKTVAKNIDYKCVICGTKYMAKNQSKYCSRKCAATGFRKKHPSYNKNFRNKT